MARAGITVREAVPEDAEVLLHLWAGLAHGVHGDRVGAPSLPEARANLARSAAEVDRRVVVAELGPDRGAARPRVVGVALLRRVPVTPLHAEEAVQLSHLQVHADYRRHGVGRALVAAAAAWAEEKDTGMVLASVSASDRDANRFLARLGLTQVATMRGASLKALRARLPRETPVVAGVDARTHRSVERTIARRRSQRLGLARPGRLG